MVREGGLSPAGPGTFFEYSFFSFGPRASLRPLGSSEVLLSWDNRLPYVLAPIFFFSSDKVGETTFEFALAIAASFRSF